MNKNILAIAIAAAVAAPSAFAAATVYGNAHMSVNSVSGVGASSNSAGAVAAAGTDGQSMTAVTSNSSFIGVKGSEDLGAGMKAVYQFELGFNLDGENGGTAANNTNTAASGLGGASRNSMVGLGGSFGTVMLGRWDSPIKMVGRKYDLFGDQVGNNRVVLGGQGLTHAVDGRHNNVIAYVSPTFSGVNATLAYVPGAGASDSAGNEYLSDQTKKRDAFSANVMYTAGKFDAGLGYINIANVLGTNTDKSMNAYRLGAGYTFGAARVNGIYQLADYSVNNDVKSLGAYGIGASYKVTAAGTVKGQYMLAENKSNTEGGANSITVGYDHAMSKNTTVYALYAAVQNNGTAANGATYSVMQANAGTGDNTVAIAGKDNSAFSVGIQHKF